MTIQRLNADAERTHAIKVDKAAQAIYEVNSERNWSDLSEEMKEMYRVDARAAIAAYNGEV
jgi:hypothetical protein